MEVYNLSIKVKEILKTEGEKLKEYSLLKTDNGFTIYVRKNDLSELGHVYLLYRVPTNLTERYKLLNMSAVIINAQDFETKFSFKSSLST